MQEPAGPYHQALFGKYLHLQYNVFVIYDEAKTVPQRPSHKSTGEHLTQKHDSKKAAAMHLCWNHIMAWVPPPPVESPDMS